MAAVSQDTLTSIVDRSRRSFSQGSSILSTCSALHPYIQYRYTVQSTDTYLYLYPFAAICPSVQVVGSRQVPTPGRSPGHEALRFQEPPLTASTPLLRTIVQIAHGLFEPVRGMVSFFPFPPQLSLDVAFPPGVGR